jgi:hypothetical protein
MIPKEIKDEIKRIVKKFNDDELDLINDFYKYIAEFKGEEVFLKIKKYEKIFPTARLRYSGDINNLEFAIFKYSCNEYDVNERFFPGSEYLDGTIKGALYACNTAYPPM